MAGGGTIVLDEVAALSPATQSKLLRVLEERRFERLGGTETLTIEARLIALTNADLARAVAAKRFREDLYFRLSVLTLQRAGAARAACRHRAAGRASARAPGRGARAGREFPSATPRERRWRATTGPETFANSRTPSSAR